MRFTNGAFLRLPAVVTALALVVTVAGPAVGTAGPKDASASPSGAIVELYSLGNRVYQEGGGTGIAGVRVTLISDLSIVATTVTGSGGYYRFDLLNAGDYVVRVDASNFGSGGALEGQLSGTPDGDPNNGVDGDDNGLGTTPGGSGILSGVIQVGNGLQPSGEADLGPGDSGVSDLAANLTIDFAFSPRTAGLYEVPTLSGFGLALMVLLLMGIAVVLLVRMRQ